MKSSRHEEITFPWKFIFVFISHFIDISHVKKMPKVTAEAEGR